MAPEQTDAVCSYAALAGGKLVEVAVGQMPVVVGLAGNGEPFAIWGRCMHQGAPLMDGVLRDTMRAPAVGQYGVGSDATALQCPWHGYEYDVATGCLLADSRRCLRKFLARRVGDCVVVSLDTGAGAPVEHAEARE